MADEAVSQSLSVRSRLQSGQRQLFSSMVAHRPFGGLMGRKIEHGGEIQPAFASGDTGKVGQSDTVGSSATNSCSGGAA